MAVQRLRRLSRLEHPVGPVDRGHCRAGRRATRDPDRRQPRSPEGRRRELRAKAYGDAGHGRGRSGLCGHGAVAPGHARTGGGPAGGVHLHRPEAPGGFDANHPLAGHRLLLGRTGRHSGIQPDQSQRNLQLQAQRGRPVDDGGTGRRRGLQPEQPHLTGYHRVHDQPDPAAGQAGTA